MLTNADLLKQELEATGSELDIEPVPIRRGNAKNPKPWRVSPDVIRRREARTVARPKLPQLN